MWIAVRCSGWRPGVLHGIQDRFLSNWWLYHDDNRGRHSANHNLLPDMHLHVPVLLVTKCLTLSLFKMSGRYLVNCKVV